MFFLHAVTHLQIVVELHSLFGFALDRGLLHTLFAFEMTALDLKQSSLLDIDTPYLTGQVQYWYALIQV
jgi:hypothetical protein